MLRSVYGVVYYCCRIMHDMLLKLLVAEVLKVSEKAASLARIVRSEESLFELLVQEKKGDQSNKRFVQDFKTLADVLVQETVRHDLGKKVSSETGGLLCRLNVGCLVKKNQPP